MGMSNGGPPAVGLGGAAPPFAGGPSGPPFGKKGAMMGGGPGGPMGGPPHGMKGGHMGGPGGGGKPGGKRTLDHLQAIEMTEELPKDIQEFLTELQGDRWVAASYMRPARNRIAVDGTRWTVSSHQNMSWTKRFYLNVKTNELCDSNYESHFVLREVSKKTGKAMWTRGGGGDDKFIWNWDANPPEKSAQSWGAGATGVQGKGPGPHMMRSGGNGKGKTGGSKGDDQEDELPVEDKAEQERWAKCIEGQLARLAAQTTGADVTDIVVPQVKPVKPADVAPDVVVPEAQPVKLADVADIADVKQEVVVDTKLEADA
eukprot:g19777.t1